MFLFHLSCSFTCNRSLQLYNRSFYYTAPSSPPCKTGYSFFALRKFLRNIRIISYVVAVPNIVLPFVPSLLGSLSRTIILVNHPRDNSINRRLRTFGRDAIDARGWLEATRGTRAVEIATTMTRVFFFSLSLSLLSETNDAHRPPTGSTFRLNAGV